MTNNGVNGLNTKESLTPSVNGPLDIFFNLIS